MKVTNVNSHGSTDWLLKSFSSKRKPVHISLQYSLALQCFKVLAVSAAGLKVALIVGDGDLAVHGFTLVHPAQRPGRRLRRLRLALGEGQVGGDAVPHSVAQHVVTVCVQQLSAGGGGGGGE